MRRFAFALTIWRWWPPVAFNRWQHRDKPYSPWADIDWPTAWAIAELPK